MRSRYSSNLNASPITSLIEWYLPLLTLSLTNCSNSGVKGTFMIIISLQLLYIVTLLSTRKKGRLVNKFGALRIRASHPTPTPVWLVLLVSHTHRPLSPHLPKQRGSN